MQQKQRWMVGELVDGMVEKERCLAQTPMNESKWSDEDFSSRKQAGAAAPGGLRAWRAVA
jgi:hypothetical protein